MGQTPRIIKWATSYGQFPLGDRTMAKVQIPSIVAESASPARRPLSRTAALAGAERNGRQAAVGATRLKRSVSPFRAIPSYLARSPTRSCSDPQCSQFCPEWCRFWRPGRESNP